MSKNEIKKKNISANALSDDDLEDVAGGFMSFGSGVFILFPSDIKKLEEAGFNVSTEQPSGLSAPKSYVTDANGNPVSCGEVDKIIYPHRYEPFHRW